MKAGNMTKILVIFMVWMVVVGWGLKRDATIKNGEIISGLPCVKRLNQLFCPSAGSSYPANLINKYIDDNRSLMRRMYGQIQQASPRSTNREVRTLNGERFRRDVLEGTLEDLEFDSFEEARETINATHAERQKRQANIPKSPNKNKNKVDICESTTEIVTPYWASNSNGKVRAVLNNNEFEQAIHQEVCEEDTTARCSRDCSCEQKYKWHRLLAYDPNNECAGIFMDWFLFPSCCVCLCNKNPFQKG